MVTLNISIGQKNCAAVAQLLSSILADSYVLYVKTQNFHWNVVDPNFYSLHKFLEAQYEALADQVDELAERIRMIGHKAPGSLQAFMALTSLEEADSGEMGAPDMLKQLLQDHESCVRRLREAIKQTGEVNDEGTQDLLIQVIRFHEKSAWMIRAQLS